LLKRRVPNPRNLAAGETLADIEAENAERGVD